MPSTLAGLGCTRILFATFCHGGTGSPSIDGEHLWGSAHRISALWNLQRSSACTQGSRSPGVHTEVPAGRGPAGHGQDSGQGKGKEVLQYSCQGCAVGCTGAMCLLPWGWVLPGPVLTQPPCTSDPQCDRTGPPMGLRHDVSVQTVSCIHSCGAGDGTQGPKHAWHMLVP